VRERAVSTELDGTWVPLAADVSGRALDVTGLRVSRLIILQETYRIVDRTDHVLDSGELLLGEPGIPRTLDIIGMEGPYAGRRMHAIIEVEGDRLCVCYDLENGERPLAMQAAQDQLLLSITYARLRAPSQLS
jgi:uncharacterized protein (TIGR03067 family)